VHGHRDGNNEIYTMAADGTAQTNLTRHPASDFNAAWSPDGTTIAFASNRSGNADIYLMNADGSSLKQLTQHSALDWNPA
jgi:Tol biopolymer transport system component